MRGPNGAPTAPRRRLQEPVTPRGSRCSSPSFHTPAAASCQAASLVCCRSERRGQCMRQIAAKKENDGSAKELIYKISFGKKAYLLQRSVLVCGTAEGRCGDSSSSQRRCLISVGVHTSLLRNTAAGVALLRRCPARGSSSAGASSGAGGARPGWLARARPCVLTPSRPGAVRATSLRTPRGAAWNVFLSQSGGKYLKLVAAMSLPGVSVPPLCCALRRGRPMRRLCAATTHSARLFGSKCRNNWQWQGC